ncbi:MAG: ATPase [Legionellales bacterium]|nr:ATPase [Legionellales bacterium]|tara:strand:- start:21826 stop:22977 length:1152 start_codon:yes stop_codon:yes gene_type:complete
MYPRLLNLSLEPKASALLFGPRGTGKTFWINQNLNNAIVFNLLKNETYTTLLANPSRIEQRIPPDFTHWVVIDEVQKIPALLDEAHRLIEAKGYKFLLTGSSARKLKQQSANLLAGRARQHTMHPLTCTELENDFRLNKALQFGMLPEVYSIDDPEQYLKTYVSTYLQEEILQEGILRDVGEFARFLEVASFSQGEILNYSEIGRESGINRKVVANFFDITIDLLLGFKLPVFTKHAQRQLVSQPKFYLFDVGVYRAIRPIGPLDSTEAIDGHALETLVLQHIRAFNDYYQLGYSLYYWRTKNGVEIDFILYGQKGLIAIEVKRKRRLSGKDLRGLRQFSEDYPMAKLYCFYGGDMPEYYDNITALPIEDGLKNLTEMMMGDD